MHLNRRSSAGREFQTRGTAAAKHRSPYVFRVHQTAHVSDDDDDDDT